MDAPVTGLARFAIAVLGAAVVVLLLLRLSWPGLVRYFTYPGGSLDPARSHPAAWGLEGGEEVRLTADDGTSLHGWWVPAHTAGAEHCGAAIYFHGNAETIATRGWIAERLTRRGLDVLLFDYRGYGLSDGEPDEAGLRRDARAAWSYVVEAKGADPEHLLLMGHSLGSAVAIDLALDHTAAALVVGSPFPSLPAVFRVHAPWLPLGLMAWNEGRYDGGTRIDGLTMPVLAIAGEADRMIPAHLTRAVYERAPDPRRLTIVPADHNTVMGRPETWRALDAFLAEHVCPG
jgi:pimeloyl-ACP methyl ester carboxylesterase